MVLYHFSEGCIRVVVAMEVIDILIGTSDELPEVQSGFDRRESVFFVGGGWARDIRGCKCLRLLPL